jgi:hypothetical protein
MSLDVYLRLEGQPCVATESTRIFIREDGATVEISREEWNRRFPDREPFSVIQDVSTDEVYSHNITHNLTRMADAAGVYTALWRPAEMLDPEKAARIREQEEAGNYHEAGGAYEIERSLPVVHARDLIRPLTDGLAKLRGNPETFKTLNPENGWGNYEGLVNFVADYLNACKEYPDAIVEVSR